MSKRQLVPTALRAELTEYASLIRALRAQNTLDITSQITRYQQKGKALALYEAQDQDQDQDDDEVDVEDDQIGSEDDDMNVWHALPADGEEVLAGPSNYMKPPLSSQPLPPSPRQSSLKRKSTRPSPSSISSQPRPKRPRRDSNKSSRTTRDTWTRWPLLLEDVPVPDWGLEDEVGLIAERLFKQSAQQKRGSVSTADSLVPASRPLTPTGLRSSEAPPPTSSPSSNIDMDDMDDESSSDSELDLDAGSPFISSLSLSTSSYLQFILASISAVIPKRAPSMQNRLNPVGWECVLEALVACSRVHGTNSSNISVSEKILNNVRRRMEAISGASSASGPVAPTAPTLSPPRLIVKSFAESQQKENSVVDPSRPLPFPETVSSTAPLSLPLTDRSALASHRMQHLLASKQRLSETLARYSASEEAILSFTPAVPLPEDSKRPKTKVLRPRRKRAPPTKRPPRRTKKKVSTVYKSTEYAADSDENHEDVPSALEDAKETGDADLPITENGNDDPGEDKNVADGDGPRADSDT